jgi:hypothetical protein
LCKKENLPILPSPSLQRGNSSRALAVRENALCDCERHQGENGGLVSGDLTRRECRETVMASWAACVCHFGSWNACTALDPDGPEGGVGGKPGEGGREGERERERESWYLEGVVMFMEMISTFSRARSFAPGELPAASKREEVQEQHMRCCQRVRRGARRRRLHDRITGLALLCGFFPVGFPARPPHKAASAADLYSIWRASF